MRAYLTVITIYSAQRFLICESAMYSTHLTISISFNSLINSIISDLTLSRLKSTKTDQKERAGFFPRILKTNSNPATNLDSYTTKIGAPLGGLVHIIIRVCSPIFVHNSADYNEYGTYTL